MRSIKKYLLLTVVFIIICIIPLINTKADTNKNLVNIYFFHSNDCTHCNSEINLLDYLEEKYDNIKIYRYEVHDQKNYEIYKQVKEIYNLKTDSVPITIIGDTMYTGYMEEKSDIKFIKTIEYYSKYGYIDKVGDLLQIETSSYYNVDENTPTIEEFIDTYGNYKLIGTLYTNDLDLSTNISLISILSQLNLVRIISFILVLILLNKIGGPKNKILLLMYYLIVSFLHTTTYIISNEVYTLIIQILTLILFMISLLGYSKNKKRQYLYSNIFIVIAILSNYLEHNLCRNYIKIFKELINLHNLTNINKLLYYTNYIAIIIIINLIILLSIYYIKKLILKKH